MGHFSPLNPPIYDSRSKIRPSLTFALMAKTEVETILSARPAVAVATLKSVATSFAAW